MSRKTIFTKDGYYIGDLRAATVRSYTLAAQGVIGECSWDMSMLDRKTSDKYLKYGKYLLVREHGLKDWIGVIYSPQPMGHGKLSVRAYQAEKILEWRGTDIEKISGTPGTLFKNVLNKTNRAELNEKQIFPNSIFEGGASLSEDLGDNAYSHLQKIAESAGHDFEVVHSFDENGRLILLGNWFAQKGIETGLTFHEGRNIMQVDDLLTKNGDLFNDYTGYNEASTPSSRIKSRARDMRAIGEYGLYQTSMVFSGVTDKATLDSRVLAELKKTIDPKKELDIVALNIGRTYAGLDTGNIWNIDLNRVNINGLGLGMNGRKTRILGMEVDDLKPNQVKLVTEVQYA